MIIHLRLNYFLLNNFSFCVRGISSSFALIFFTSSNFWYPVWYPLKQKCGTVLAALYYSNSPFNYFCILTLISRTTHVNAHSYVAQGKIRWKLPTYFIPEFVSVIQAFPFIICVTNYTYSNMTLALLLFPLFGTEHFLYCWYS